MRYTQIKPPFKKKNQPQTVADTKKNHISTWTIHVFIKGGKLGAAK